jgi:hypothetical protein
MASQATFEPREMARRAAIVMGSNNLHRALWREHPRTMSRLFIAGKAEAPMQIVIVQPPPVVVRVPSELPQSPVTSGKARVGIAPALIDRVANAFEISHGELIGSGRSRKFIAARAVVARVLRHRGWSTSQIGKVLRRDHSTIIHLLDRWSFWSEFFPEALELYQWETAA